MTAIRHWTGRSVEDFVFKISSDFVFQLVKKMEAEQLAQKTLAERLGVSVGRVSQVLNNPGNLTLKNCVQYARTLGMKTALVAYDDVDPENNLGPVNSELFYRCWQMAGSPRDFFAVANEAQRQLATPRIRLTYLVNYSQQGGSADTPTYRYNLRGTESNLFQRATTPNDVLIAASAANRR